MLSSRKPFSSRTDQVLRSLSVEFDKLYAATGGRSIAPEYILRALLLQVFYSIGTVASFGASRLIASLLFGTTPTDPITFLGMVVVLGAIALLAGYIPARRASRINPMVALRNN